MQHIEQIFNKLLQHNIVFTSGESKIYKEGKLIMFKVKDFYLIFSIKIGNSIKVVELPYPYKIITTMMLKLL